MQAADWPACQILLNATPMTARIPLVLRREGSHKSVFPRLGSGGGISIVAEDDGEIVGFIHGSVSLRHVWWSSEPVLVAYGGDLRVAPHARGRGLGRKLNQALLAEAGARGIRSAIALINEGNDKALSNLRTMDASTTMTLVTTFGTAWALPRPGRSLTPWNGDLEQIVSRFTRPLAPAVGKTEVQQFLRDHASVRLYARRETPDRFCFALWDVSERRSLQVGPLRIRSAEMLFCDGDVRSVGLGAWNARCHLGLYPVGANGVPDRKTAMRTHMYLVGLGWKPPPPPTTDVHFDLAFL